MFTDENTGLKKHSLSKVTSHTSEVKLNLKQPGSRAQQFTALGSAACPVRPLLTSALSHFKHGDFLSILK